MSCGNIKRKADKICVGDLKRLIKIINRKIEPADISHTMDFDSFNSVRARVDTRRGIDFFNGVNTENAPTHYFYVRYNVDVEMNYTIEFRDNYYLVVDVENLNEENRFLKISAVKNGPKSNATNWA